MVPGVPGDVTHDVPCAPAARSTASSRGPQWCAHATSSAWGWYVTRPTGRPHTSRTPASRSTRFVACGRSSPCIVNATILSRVVESAIERGVVGAGRQEQRLDDRVPVATVLDDAAAQVRQTGRPRRRRALGVADDRVVHEVGDVAALVRVQPEREEPEHDRLQVEHEEAADQVRRVPDAAAQQEPRGLERTARDHDRVGGHRALDAVAVEVAHPGAARPPRRRPGSRPRCSRAGARTARAASERRSIATGSPLASIGQP